MPDAPRDEHEAEFLRWRDARLKRLRSDHGWLSLSARHVLEPGAQSLPFGRATLEGGHVRVDVRPDIEATVNGSPVTVLDVEPIDDGPATMLDVGPVRYEIARLRDEVVVRVRDPSNPRRTAFRGFESFPYDAAWRLRARYEPCDERATIEVAYSNGRTAEKVTSARLAFDHHGTTHRLLVVGEPGAARLFTLFVDATSGRDTYGAGRYLEPEPPDAAGYVVLDFNKAYNPPCAYTDFASCPLPPAQNRLPFRVEAGEKL